MAEVAFFNPTLHKYAQVPVAILLVDNFIDPLNSLSHCNLELRIIIASKFGNTSSIQAWEA